MPGWRPREFHPDGLDAILHLWGQDHATATEPDYGLCEVIASCRKDHAVVAVHG